MEKINLEAKFQNIDSLKSIFAEIIGEVEEGYQSNYDGITEHEDFCFHIITVHRTAQLENNYETKKVIS